MPRAEQAHVLSHEGVHAFLSVPDSAFAAGWRQTMGIHAYKSSAFLTALEETLAEGIASGSIWKGLSHAFNGAYLVRGDVVVTKWNAATEMLAGLFGYGGLIWGTYEFGNWLWGDE